MEVIFIILHVMVHLQLLEHSFIRGVEVVQLLRELMGRAIEGFRRGSAILCVHRIRHQRSRVREDICRTYPMHGGP